MNGTPDDLGTQVIVLASGEGFADALSVVERRPTGGARCCSREGVPPADDRDRAPDDQPPEGDHPRRHGVVSAAVESAVKAAVPASTVTRAGGPTASAPPSRCRSRPVTGAAPEVFLVNGFNFPDALASAPSAGFSGASTLLTKATSSPRVPAPRRADSIPRGPPLSVARRSSPTTPCTSAPPAATVPSRARRPSGRRARTTRHPLTSRDIMFTRPTLLTAAVAAALVACPAVAGSAAAASSPAPPSPVAPRWAGAAISGKALTDAVRGSAATTAAAAGDYQTFRVAGRTAMRPRSSRARPSTPTR